jgi:hypothetical protein
LPTSPRDRNRERPHWATQLERLGRYRTRAGSQFEVGLPVPARLARGKARAFEIALAGRTLEA